MTLEELLQCEPGTHSFKLTSDSKGTRGVAWFDGEKQKVAWKKNPVDTLLAISEIHDFDFEGAIPKVMLVEYNRHDGDFMTVGIVEEGEEKVIHQIPTAPQEVEVVKVEEEEEDTKVQPYRFDEDAEADSELWARRRLVMRYKTVHGMSEREIAEILESEHGIKVSNVTVHKDIVAVRQRHADNAVEDFKRHQAIQLAKLDAREREAVRQYHEIEEQIKNLEALTEQAQLMEDYDLRYKTVASLQSQIVKCKDQALKWFAAAGKEIDRNARTIGSEVRAKAAMEVKTDGHSQVRLIMG